MAGAYVPLRQLRQVSVNGHWLDEMPVLLQISCKRLWKDFCNLIFDPLQILSFFINLFIVKYDLNFPLTSTHIQMKESLK